jgi:hypothetical protein
MLSQRRRSVRQHHTHPAAYAVHAPLHAACACTAAPTRSRAGSASPPVAPVRPLSTFPMTLQALPETRGWSGHFCRAPRAAETQGAAADFTTESTESEALARRRSAEATAWVRPPLEDEDNECEGPADALGAAMPPSPPPHSQTHTHSHTYLHTRTHTYTHVHTRTHTDFLVVFEKPNRNSFAFYTRCTGIAQWAQGCGEIAPFPIPRSSPHHDHPESDAHIPLCTRQRHSMFLHIPVDCLPSAVGPPRPGGQPYGRPRQCAVVPMVMMPLLSPVLSRSSPQYSAPPRPTSGQCARLIGLCGPGWAAPPLWGGGLAATGQAGSRGQLARPAKVQGTCLLHSLRSPGPPPFATLGWAPGRGGVQ